MDRLNRLCDSSDMAQRNPNLSLYEALMAIKPDDLTLNAWTVKAGVNRNAFNDIRKSGNANNETLEKLLTALGVSWATFDAARGSAPADDKASDHSYRSPVSDFRGPDRPRDVPVLGTPTCGDLTLGDQHIETIDVDLDEIVDYVRRPPTLDGRSDIYAIYYTGFSMVPRFEPDEVGYVDPKRPPSIGDYVVIQLRRGGEDRIVSALVKRLVRRTADYVELEQFNPALIFRLPANRVARMHRIIPLHELVGF